MTRPYCALRAADRMEKEDRCSVISDAFGTPEVPDEEPGEESEESEDGLGEEGKYGIKEAAE